MPTVEDNTILQKVFAAFNKAIEPIYDDLVKEINKNLNKGLSVAKATDKAFFDIGYDDIVERLYAESLALVSTEATIGTAFTVEAELASKYFLFTDFKGGSLSKNIRSGASQKIVKAQLKEFFTKQRAITTLFKDLQAGGSEVIGKLPNAITRTLANYRQLGINNPAVEKQLRDARLYVSTLQGGEISSVQLKTAYTKLLDAVEKNEKELINGAVDYAVKRKVDYNNKRLARTEFGRAYEMTFQRAIDEDQGIQAFQVVLSSAHVITDICDAYAEADMYGLGAGVYPKDAGVNIPFHPNCLCSKVPIRAPLPLDGQFSEKRTKEYLAGLNDRDRASIVGKSNSTNQNDYIKGLEKHGFGITKAPKMLPEKLVILD